MFNADDSFVVVTESTKEMDQTAESITNSFVFENFKNTIKEYSTKTGKLHSFTYEKRQKRVYML